MVTLGAMFDLEQAVKDAGGVTAVARQFPVHHAAVIKWFSKGVPAERVPRLASILGIPRHVLRPDLYDAPTPVPVTPAAPQPEQAA